jgi:hypothetical protein
MGTVAPGGSWRGTLALAVALIPAVAGCSCDEEHPAPGHDAHPGDVAVDRADVADTSVERAEVPDRPPDGPAGAGDLAADLPTDLPGPDLMPDAPVTIDQACEAVSAICEQLAVCNVLEYAETFGTTQNCTDINRQRCRAMAKDAMAAPGEVARCMLAIAAQCGYVDEATLHMPACAIQGNRTDGEGCSHSWQCMSGYCDLPSTSPLCTGRTCAQQQPSACGICRPRAPQGAECTASGECELALACSEGLCRQAVGIGQLCDVARPCAGTAVCRNGVCAGRAAVGASCGPTAPCSRDSFLVCDAASGTCRLPPIADTGKPCGEPGLGAVCGPANRCVAAFETTVCVPRSNVGTPCEPNRPACPRYASCVAGVCTVDTLAACR